MEETKIELQIIRMSEVQAQEVEWLWFPFIPHGKLTIGQGDPGDGKTTLVLNIAAKLSKGEGVDNDMKLTEPVNVIYQTAEDGLADTVKPRFELAETNNAMQSNEIVDLADEQGISKCTLKNAKKELSIRAKRINNSWYWELDKIRVE